MEQVHFLLLILTPSRENSLVCLSASQKISCENELPYALATSVSLVSYTCPVPDSASLELLGFPICKLRWVAETSGVSISNSSQRCLYLSNYFIVNTVGLWVQICFREYQHHYFRLGRFI